MQVLAGACLDEDDETWKRVLSEMESPGPRNSGSGDIGYGFVDFRGPGFEQSNYGLRDWPVASAYGPSTEGAGTRVCGYAIKNSGLTGVR